MLDLLREFMQTTALSMRNLIAAVWGVVGELKKLARRCDELERKIQGLETERDELKRRVTRCENAIWREPIARRLTGKRKLMLIGEGPLPPLEPPSSRVLINCMSERHFIAANLASAMGQCSAMLAQAEVMTPVTAKEETMSAKAEVTMPAVTAEETMPATAEMTMPTVKAKATMSASAEMTKPVVEEETDSSMTRATTRAPIKMTFSNVLKRTKSNVLQ